MANEGPLDLLARGVGEHLLKLLLERQSLALLRCSVVGQRFLCQPLGALLLENSVGVETSTFERGKRGGDEGVQ